MQALELGASFVLALGSDVWREVPGVRPNHGFWREVPGVRPYNGCLERSSGSETQQTDPGKILGRGKAGTKRIFRG